MPAEQLSFLAVAVVVIAFLYSSVGHAGASGYIAVMALAGLAPAVVRPTALLLNVVVASISSVQFWRAGHFSWRLFWPFALLSSPLAFVGGSVDLPSRAFKGLVGVVLLLSAVRLLWRPPNDEATREPSRPLSIALGGGLGLLSGLTGTGGGIFLTPILLFARWAPIKQAAGVSAVFILVNSVAGLFGNVTNTGAFPTFAVPLGVGAAFGGFLGSYLGSRRLNQMVIKRLLACVLVIAGAKLSLTAFSVSG